MADWTVTYTVGEDAKTETVTAADLTSANDVAVALVDAASGQMVSVVMVDPAAAALASGIAKLVDLGLTAEEAQAVASSSSSA